MHNNFLKRIILMVFLGLLAIYYSPLSLANEIPRSAQEVLKDLVQKNGELTEVKWNNETQTPTLLRGKFTQSSNHSLTWIAYELLNRLKPIYGLSNPHRDLKVIEIGNISSDIRYVRFQHMVFKTPVFGDELIVEIDNEGIARRIYGTVHPKLNLQLFNRPMVAAISENQAQQIAHGSLSKNLPIFSHSEAAKYYLPTRKGTPLVYVIKYHFDDPQLKDRTVIVHALTGHVIS